MIVQSIRFTFEPADADKIQSIMLKLRDSSRKEPGVVSFDVGQSLDEPVFLHSGKSIVMPLRLKPIGKPITSND